MAGTQPEKKVYDQMNIVPALIDNIENSDLFWQTAAYLSETHNISCYGRDDKGRKVLKRPVEVQIELRYLIGNIWISSFIRCPYNSTGRRHKCEASKSEGEPYCPFSFDYRIGEKHKLWPKADVLKNRFLETILIELQKSNL